MRKVAWFAMGFGALLVGCNQPDAAKLGQDAQTMAKDAGAAASSLTLAGKVQTALRLRKGIDASTLHIEAKDGVVTITGHVKDPTERSNVYAVVSNTVGVDKVIDTDLKVDSLK